MNFFKFTFDFHYNNYISDSNSDHHHLPQPSDKMMPSNTVNNDIQLEEIKQKSEEHTEETQESCIDDLSGNYLTSSVLESDTNKKGNLVSGIENM
jgi:hypothetical protein